MAKAKQPALVYQLKMTLQSIRPPIWRRVQVKDCTLAKLDDLIQICMGWGGGHLHAFEIGGVEFGAPDPFGMAEYEDERRMKLSQVVAEGFKKFTYTYDFGDDWRHVIQVEKTLPADPDVRYPRCLTGARACPPEDCGGPWGYADFVAAMGDPKHSQHDELAEWLGGDFDPEAFDVEAIDARLRGRG